MEAEEVTDDLVVNDALYGKISVPGFLVPFLRLPEFVRLRGVRLSNLDSIEFKDLNGPTRWEHAIGVLHLASRCAEERGMGRAESIELQLAGLLHDIATPPFAHTAEYVLEAYDHELETSRLLAGDASRDVAPNAAIYLSEAPRFRNECLRLARELRLRIDPDRVAQMVVGEGNNGFLLAGSVDLDNADNVTRAALHMGLAPRQGLALELAYFLARCDSAPTDLLNHNESVVREWAELRRAMYGAFFNQGPVERGREAFLQHLFRSAVRAGIPRRQLVWNTDEGLLWLLETYRDAEGHTPLRDAVKRYRLLEDPLPLVSIPIYDEEEFSSLTNPLAVSWLESRLTGPFFEAIVSVARNRFASDRHGVEPLGEVRIFKLGSGLSRRSLPQWIRDEVPADVRGRSLLVAVRRVLTSSVASWSRAKPWFTDRGRSSANVKANLDAVGNWEFRLSRNRPLHTYPSTFVQELPASLIHALDMRGELALDPFGGTGNTALASIMAGGRGITADSNQIATLIARVRGTYLGSEAVSIIESASRAEIESLEPAPSPDLQYLDRWHHPATEVQLRQILSFVNRGAPAEVRDFSRLAFSSILTSCTSRRGEEGSYFADNTPLRRGESDPPRVDAVELFLSSMRRNLAIQQNLFARLEGSGGDARSMLDGYRAVDVDALHASPDDYGVARRSVPLILTSPPYLNMTDYSLGQRLSYAWLGLDMASDFRRELSPRRSRPRVSRSARTDSAVSHSAVQVAAYLDGISAFAANVLELMAPHGFLTLVQGEPTARAFANVDVLSDVDARLLASGFELMWSTWRPISWARHHGFARLKTERIAVYRVS